MAEYVITDGSRFIYKNHKNKYVPIGNEVMADKFSKKQADGVLNNSLPKGWSLSYGGKYIYTQNSNKQDNEGLSS